MDSKYKRSYAEERINSKCLIFGANILGNYMKRAFPYYAYLHLEKGLAF